MHILLHVVSILVSKLHFNVIKMKKSLIYMLCALLAGTFSMTSCTDYLEKDAESVLQKEDAFKNFNNFQGFVEVMYNVIPDVAKSH